MAPCPHPASDVYWRVGAQHEAACNEAGWWCSGCRQFLAFRPDLDRAFLELKVWCLLHDLHDAGLVYVSNGTQSDVICQGVAARCRDAGVFDQYSILRFLLTDPNLAGDEAHGHARYWHDRAAAWLADRAPEAAP